MCLSNKVDEEVLQARYPLALIGQEIAAKIPSRKTIKESANLSEIILDVCF